MTNLINSEIVDAFVKAFEAYQDPGDSFRSCVRAALTEVAPLIVERDEKIIAEQESSYDGHKDLNPGHEADRQ